MSQPATMPDLRTLPGASARAKHTVACRVARITAGASLTAGVPPPSFQFIGDHPDSIPLMLEDAPHMGGAAIEDLVQRMSC